MNNTIRLTSSVDAAEAGPYLLGYQPDDQLVILAMSGPRLLCTAALPMGRAEREAQTALLPLFADDNHVTDVLLLAYTSRSNAADMLDRVAADAVPWEVTVRDRIVVSPTAITSAVTGVSLARTSQTPAVAVEMVVSGIPQPVTNRRERAARYSGHVERITARKAVGAVRPLTLAHEVAAAHNGPMSAEVAARLAAALTADALAFQCHTMNRELAAEALSLWAQVSTYYGDDETDPEVDRVLIMTGFSGFLSGEGVALVTILERLDARRRAGVLTPEMDPFARLLDHFNAKAISPQAWIEANAR